MDTLRRHRSLILAGLVIAAVIAAGSAWLASSEPDGLERVATDQGFGGQAEEPGFELLPGYSVPGLSGELSTALAGVIGVAIVAALTLGAGYLLRARRAQSTPAPPPHAPSSGSPKGDRGS